MGPGEIKDLKGSSTKSARRILHLREEPRMLLATILVANNFINIGIVLLADYVLRNVIPENVLINLSSQIVNASFLKTWCTASNFASVINFLLAVVGVTFILVLFGEIVPKIYAKFNNLAHGQADEWNAFCS